MESAFLCYLIIATKCNGIADVCPAFGTRLNLVGYAPISVPPLDASKNVDITNYDENHSESGNSYLDDHDTEDHDASEPSDIEYIRKFWICVAILASFLIAIYWM